MGFGLDIGSVVTGALGFIGQEKTNAKNEWMQRDANEASLMSAREQMAFQERMSNTAHQREIEDLKKAGLNPILSGTGGSGASAPSGASATFGAARMEDALGKGISSAMASRQLEKDLEMADSQKALNVSSVQTQQSQQDVNASTAAKLREDTLRVAQENNIKSPAVALMRDTQIQQAQADLKKAQIDNKMATYDAIQNRVGAALNDANKAKDLIDPFKGLKNIKNLPPPGEIFKNREGKEVYYDKNGKLHKTDHQHWLDGDDN